MLHYVSSFCVQKQSNDEKKGIPIKFDNCDSWEFNCRLILIYYPIKVGLTSDFNFRRRRQIFIFFMLISVLLKKCDRADKNHIDKDIHQVQWLFLHLNIYFVIQSGQNLTIMRLL